VVAYTLPDYFDDPALSLEVRRICTTTHRLEGSLGGGAVFICRVEPGAMR
jgi:hypothetical protein